MTETSKQETELSLEIDAGAEAEPDELDELTSKLRRQLLELDVESVERPAAGAAPTGAKAVDPVALGTLIVTLVKSPAAVAGVARAVQSWISGQQRRSVKLQIDGDTIEVTGVSSSDQERLVTAWIERHAG